MTINRSKLEIYRDNFNAQNKRTIQVAVFKFNDKEGVEYRATITLLPIQNVNTDKKIEVSNNIIELGTTVGNIIYEMSTN